ncbi:tripartite-type tricarboxylate transporter receptor subunit TctC [Comamonas sp. BIGb0152]|uniref:Bug family tripartite tricarboxylate transporter substrate binding protein n=1 Tax=Comamonas sp. BIGb0152 TaxID=2940601 RepID=UPI00216A692F|nr:tripartite tricarboxylate transporter substrate binding protein [Comamonas sp. BIGb0152]MCS4296277.1 tripartite-type tricarboxylate transporter receptor subunit TctC [Comamonas sp. BIGb0152]
MTLIKRLVLSVAACFAAPMVSVVHAQGSYPSKPVSIIVPQAPGGASDVIVRLLAHQMSQILGQSVVVENKPGAGGNIGTVYVARTKADGHTLLFNQVAHVINPALYRKVGYDTERDFMAIASVADGAFLLVANANSGIKSVADLVAKAKRQPTEVRYASAGNGTVNHLAGAMLEKTAEIQLLHVPYKGGAESAMALATGDVDISFQAPASAQPFVQRGQVLILAVTNRQQQSLLSSTPTVGETVRGYEVTPWYGLFAPKGTPEPIAQALNAAVNKALASKDLQDKLMALGVTPTPGSRADFSRMVSEETLKWQRLVKEAGAQID